MVRQETAAHNLVADSRLVLALKMAAPYIAVAVFWLGFRNAWLAILAYHAQILWWARGTKPQLTRPRYTPLSLLLLPAALAGPALYIALPLVIGDDLSPWLTESQLTGTAFLLMIGYFGLLHPILEQTHWAPLRERTPIAHFAFAGYHLLVLYSLLSWPWLALCFVVLVATSWVWQRLATESDSLVLPIASHALADLGIIIAAWLRV